MVVADSKLSSQGTSDMSLVLYCVLPRNGTFAAASEPLSSHTINPSCILGTFKATIHDSLRTPLTIFCDLHVKLAYLSFELVTLTIHLWHMWQ